MRYWVSFFIFLSALSSVWVVQASPLSITLTDFDQGPGPYKITIEVRESLVESVNALSIKDQTDAPADPGLDESKPLQPPAHHPAKANLPWVWFFLTAPTGARRIAVVHCQELLNPHSITFFQKTLLTVQSNGLLAVGYKEQRELFGTITQDEQASFFGY